MIEAVVFDMDGVIFDSETLLIDGWVAATKADGIPDVEETCHACLGTNDAETKEIFLMTYGQDFPYDAYEEDARRYYHRKADGGMLPQKKGVKELLTFLKERRVKIALETSSSKELVLQEIEEGGLLPYFDCIVCGDMISRSKPDPEIYLTACEKLGVKPINACAVEDSFNGIRSATRAGMTAIMVPDIKQPDEEMKKLAAVILPSLLAVKEYLWDRC